MVAEYALAPTPTSRPYRKLGQRLRDLRRMARLRQEDVAVKLSISEGYVSNLEAGRYRPTPDVIDKYVEVLGADYNELAELAGYIRPRAEAEWNPPPDKAPWGRQLIETFTPEELQRLFAMGISAFRQRVGESIEESRRELGIEREKAAE